MTPGSACLLVRSRLADVRLHDEFDDWYGRHHIRLVMRTLGARRGWRFWSESDPSVHLALYEFHDLGTLRARMESDGLRELVADFDATWGERVSRTRELIELVDAATDDADERM